MTNELILNGTSASLADRIARLRAKVFEALYGFYVTTENGTARFSYYYEAMEYACHVLAKSEKNARAKVFEKTPLSRHMVCEVSLNDFNKWDYMTV